MSYEVRASNWPNIWRTCFALWKILLMEEIRLTSWYGSLSHYLRRALYIPGGSLGFLPSTVWVQFLHPSLRHMRLWKLCPCRYPFVKICMLWLWQLEIELQIHQSKVRSLGQSHCQKWGPQLQECRSLRQNEAFLGPQRMCSQSLKANERMKEKKHGVHQFCLGTFRSCSFWTFVDNLATQSNNPGLSPSNCGKFSFSKITRSKHPVYCKKNGSHTSILSHPVDFP